MYGNVVEGSKIGKQLSIQTRPPVTKQAAINAGTGRDGKAREVKKQRRGLENTGFHAEVSSRFSVLVLPLCRVQRRDGSS